MCLNQMKLDSIDAAILKQLLADGRASLRDIAKKTSLSTPTVSSHFYRMIKAGLITKFVPVINLNETELHGILALVNLKVQGSPHPPLSLQSTLLLEDWRESKRSAAFLSQQEKASSS